MLCTLIGQAWCSQWTYWEQTSSKS